MQPRRGDFARGTVAFISPAEPGGRVPAADRLDGPEHYRDRFRPGMR